MGWVRAASFRSLLRRLSAGGRRSPGGRFALVVAVFVAIQAVILALSLMAVDGIDAARAYVASEGAYATAQKAAVLSLHRYASSGDARFMAEFRQAIAVPIGDRLAREELDKTPADRARIDAALLQGENDPRDFAGLMQLYRWLSWWQPFARAVEDWREDDRLVTELAALGEELRQAVGSGAAGAARRDRLLTESDAFDGQISAREASFARHMGEAARAMRRLVMIGLPLGSLALWAIGLGLSWQAFRKSAAADRRFAASEERFRDFANVASDWFWETDTQHRLVYLSGRAMTAADGARIASLGQTPLEFAGADPADEAWQRHLADVKARRPFRDFSVTFRRRDGKERVWSISGAPVYDAGGAFVGYRGTGTDVTRERQAQQALYQAKEQAESASRAKSEFVANISHELRTPLNAILGFAEIIRDRLLGPIGDPRYAEYARDIHSSGSHLLGIINDILDLSKVEAGRLELIDEIVDVQNIVKGVALLLRERVAAGGLHLKIDLPDTLLLLRADERKLKQILMNLLSNAVKFTPAGGEIVIRVRVERERALIIEVSDTGIGIAPKDIVRALSPFGQIDTRMSRRYEGTGLGLPLAKALAELHGGKLALESTPGEGTTVRITLPAERLVENDMRRWAHAGAGVPS